MTDSNTNPYAGSGQSPWQPEQAPAPSSESDSGAANPSGEAGSQQPNNTYPGGGSVPPQTPYNPYAQGGTPYGQQYNPNYSQPYAQQYGYMPQRPISSTTGLPLRALSARSLPQSSV